jgi:serine protease Do
VGINTLVLFQGQGLGFSLPIDLVKKLLPQLKEKGRVIRSWLGVVVREITLEIKEALNLLVDRGSLITEVVADSPAYEAGIRRNDVIIEFDGHTIKNSRELPMRIAHSPSGKKMPMKVVREGETISIDVVLAEIKNRGRQ